MKTTSCLGLGRKCVPRAGQYRECFHVDAL
jgi:hypothetical protein